MKKFFAALLVVCIASIILSFYYHGYRRTWRQVWNIQTYSSPFLDMRIITGSAESLASGYDPRVDNFYDPFHREFNYPLIWYPLLESGVINSYWTIPLAIVVIVLFFMGLVLFPGKLNYLSIFFLLLTTFSSAVMLGVERGNVDLIFFFIISLALVFIEIQILFTLLLLLIGVLFKIYPVFAVGGFLNADRGKSIKYIVAFAVSAVLYFIVMYPDMRAVFSLTPKDDYLSYGVSVLAVHSSKVYGIKVSFLSTLLYVFSFALLVSILYLGIRKQGKYPSPDVRNGRAFWVGAGIYIGTFLLGNNYDYRLMFLLFAVPQLTEWGFQSEHRSWIARLMLLALVISCWYDVIVRLSSVIGPNGSDIVYYINQFMNWFLFAGLSYLIVASLPNWMWIDLKRMLSKMQFSANN